MSVAGSNHEAVAGGLNDVGRHLVDAVEGHDPSHLREQALHEPEVAARDADHRRLRLDCVELGGIEGDAEVAGMGREQQAHLGFGERLELMNEPDARVELGIASKALFQAWHAHKDQAEALAIGHIPEMLERLDGQAVGLINDDEGAGDAGGIMGGFLVRAACNRQPRIAHLDQTEAQHRVDRLGRVADRDGIEDGAATGDLFGEKRRNGTERGILSQVGEAGKLARRSGLSDTRSAMTYTDIAVVRAGFGKLDEPGMFARRQERLLDRELNRQRRRAGGLGR